MKAAWPFPDPPDLAVITVQAVLDGAPILHVTHDADDGGWQFHTAGEPTVEEGRVMSLESVFASDPSLREIADLPLGWSAWREALGATWTRARMPEEPASFHCAICGHEHEGPILDVGYRRPDAFLRVPEDERERRCRSSDDLCRIDGERFFIRGVLMLPLTDLDDAAVFGVWTEVSRADFDRYEEIYDDPRQGDEPPFPGVLATAIRGFEDTEGLAVELRTTTPQQRPLITVRDERHALAMHQARGLPLREWFAIFHRLGL